MAEATGFVCGGCGEELETPQGLLEQTVKCPTCGLVSYVLGVLPGPDPLAELSRVVNQRAGSRPVVRASAAPVRIKRIKPLASLGVLGLLLLVTAAVVWIAGTRNADRITADAAFTSNLNSTLHLSREWSDLGVSAARGESVDRLSENLSEQRDDRDVEGAYERARQVEATSQTWAAVLCVLGLILAVLGFSYSRDQIQA